MSRLGIDAMMEPVPDGGTPLHFAASVFERKRELEEGYN